MSFFLRRSDNKKWLPPDNAGWLKAGDIYADPVGEMATNNNKLSLWEVDNNRANLDRVIAALAATRNNFQHFQYSLVERKLIEGLDINLEKTIGQTPDEIVNQYHYDLIEMSGSKLISLAMMMLSNATRTEMLKNEVEKQIFIAVNEGRFNNMKLVNEKIRKKVLET